MVMLMECAKPAGAQRRNDRRRYRIARDCSHSHLTRRSQLDELWSARQWMGGVRPPMRTKQNVWCSPQRTGMCAECIILLTSDLREKSG
jgi:hypothetical protein